MTDHTTVGRRPARARSDSAPWPSVHPPGIDAAGVRSRGAALAVGTFIWAAIFLIWNPQAGGIDARMSDIGGLAFQIGLLGLLWVQLRTGATGTTRFARGMIWFEYCLLLPAIAWSVIHAVVPASVQDDTWLKVLDTFWPLSMIGMAVIGVKIAVAGRWRGRLRWWPMFAESWAIVTVPTLILFGEGPGRVIAAAHLVVGYMLVGVWLARRPDLVLGR